MRILVTVLAALSVLLPVHAVQAEAEVGVVVMHGKGGSPARHVDGLAAALGSAGWLVDNLEMPWSGRRHYDVAIPEAVHELSRALDALRARGARKVFVAGHSQGALFAIHYATLHKVDGVVAVAPGGQVDSAVLVSALAAHVERAKQMVGEGRGNEQAQFADFEGSRGTSPVMTTAANYLSWFDPEGAHTSRVFASLREGVPLLYVAPTRDYPGLSKSKQKNFSALPAHALTRLYEPESDHMGAPAAAAAEIVAWIRQVVSQP